MTERVLPNCTCGRNEWRQGGCTMGAGYSAHHFCPCGLRALEISNNGYSTFSIFPDGPKGVPDDFTETFLQPVFDWFNTKLATASRAYEMDGWMPLKKAKENEDADAIAGTFGLDPAKGYHYKSEYNDDHKLVGEWYEDDEGNRLPVDGKALIEAFRAGYVQYNPRTLLAPENPPLWPEMIFRVYLGTEGGWKHVPREEARTEEIIDPIRRNHDEFWAGVFKEVQDKSGRTFEPTVIPNQYYGDSTKSEPWYTFVYAETEFTVGPRKRVISLSMKSERLFAVDHLRDLGKRDKVTYESSGRWQGPEDHAKSLTIHAWGRDKLIEYLLAALEFLPVEP